MLERRRRFQFCIERFQSIGRLFLKLPKPGIFVILEARLPEPRTVGRRTRCCGSEASEAIPFPGADSIFSSRCGAISGRLRFCRRALSRRDSRRPKRLGSKDRQPGLGDLRRGGLGSYATFFPIQPVPTQEAAPPRPGSAEAWETKKHLSMYCVYQKEKSTQRNRRRPVRGKIAPEPAPSCEAGAAANAAQPSVGSVGDHRPASRLSR
jgi:hypothetical protein